MKNSKKKMNKPRSSPPRLFARHRQLLSLLAALGGQVNNLDFQKLLFLRCHELDGPPPYDFVPYKYGAFSFTSYYDRNKLTRLGLLAEDDDCWRLTEKGRQYGDQISLPLQAFVDETGPLRGDDLVAHTYRTHPYYASRSRIANSLLSKEPEQLKRIDEARPKSLRGPLFTIGYEGCSLESYFNTLLRENISVLCDVRRNAISRKWGFSKTSLSRTCSSLGIRYLHVPQLGISSNRRANLDSGTQRTALFADYSRNDLPRATESIEMLQTLLQDHERIALTCYEYAPEDCHRHCVAHHLQSSVHHEAVHLTPT